MVWVSDHVERLYLEGDHRVDPELAEGIKNLIWPLTTL